MGRDRRVIGLRRSSPSWGRFTPKREIRKDDDVAKWVLSQRGLFVPHGHDIRSHRRLLSPARSLAQHGASHQLRRPVLWSGLALTRGGTVVTGTRPTVKASLASRTPASPRTCRDDVTGLRRRSGWQISIGWDASSAQWVAVAGTRMSQMAATAARVRHGSTGASAEGKTLGNPYLLRGSMTIPTPTIIGGSHDRAGWVIVGVWRSNSVKELAENLCGVCCARRLVPTAAVVTTALAVVLNRVIASQRNGGRAVHLPGCRWPRRRGWSKLAAVEEDAETVDALVDGDGVAFVGAHRARGILGRPVRWPSGSLSCVLGRRGSTTSAGVNYCMS